MFKRQQRTCRRREPRRQAQGASHGSSRPLRHGHWPAEGAGNCDGLHSVGGGCPGCWAARRGDGWATEGRGELGEARTAFFPPSIHIRMASIPPLPKANCAQTNQGIGCAIQAGCRGAVTARAGCSAAAAATTSPFPRATRDGFNCSPLACSLLLCHGHLTVSGFRGDITSRHWRAAQASKRDQLQASPASLRPNAAGRRGGRRLGQRLGGWACATGGRGAGWRLDWPKRAALGARPELGACRPCIAAGPKSGLPHS